MKSLNATLNRHHAKERPILFSGPMVRAILAGRKTQTRRVVKAKNPLLEVIQNPKDGKWFGLVERDHNRGAMFTCRYGVPGDRLWVRETHAFIWPGDSPVPREQCKVEYRADTDAPLPGQWPEENRGDPDCPRWIPSIHMTRAACRIVLEITRVRIERLQDIRGKDIISEGAVDRAHHDQFGRNPVSAFDGKCYLDLVSLWQAGWDSINGKSAPWSANPWVWVVEFKRQESAMKEAA